MRTTITLDPDVAARVRSLARERGLTFKEAVNALLRAGLAGGRAPNPFRVEATAMGLRPGIDLDHALRLSSAIEDEEIARKLELRK